MLILHAVWSKVRTKSWRLTWNPQLNQLFNSINHYWYTKKTTEKNKQKSIQQHLYTEAVVSYGTNALWRCFVGKKATPFEMIFLPHCAAPQGITQDAFCQLVTVWSAFRQEWTYGCLRFWLMEIVSSASGREDKCRDSFIHSPLHANRYM